MTHAAQPKHSSAPAKSLTMLPLLGGWLCLDYVNTVDPRHGDHPHEYVSSYADLVEWSYHAGQLSVLERDRLLQRARHQAGGARRLFEEALTLRETLYRIFSALAHASEPSPADLAVVREAYAQAIGHAALVRTPEGTGFAWTWLAPDELQDETLEHVLWPIAASAVALLTSDLISRVKECAVGEGGCGWLFLDTSKNGSRRWCSMGGCGSRAKMRRQYARKRLSLQTGAPGE